jgi:hypothetical protein
MVFALFKKKKKDMGLPGKADIDIPPIPMGSMPEESIELPTFPSLEEFEKPKKKEAAPSSVNEMEELAVKEVEDELEERGGLELTTPIFVEASFYKGVMDDLGVLKNVLKDSSDRLQMISDLRDDKEKNYNIWHKQIEDIQKKLIYADNSLFGKKPR